MTYRIRSSSGVEDIGTSEGLATRLAQLRDSGETVAVSWGSMAYYVSLLHPNGSESMHLVEDVRRVPVDVVPSHADPPCCSYDTATLRVRLGVERDRFEAMELDQRDPAAVAEHTRRLVGMLVDCEIELLERSDRARLDPAHGATEAVNAFECDRCRKHVEGERAAVMSSRTNRRWSFHADLCDSCAREASRWLTSPPAPRPASTHAKATRSSADA